MTRQVRVSRRAQRDADVIFDWLAQRSTDGAARWYESYLTTLRSLQDRGPGCPLAPEADDLGVDLRQAQFQTRKGRTYRVLFIMQETLVHIIRVRGAGQDLVTGDDIERSE